MASSDHATQSRPKLRVDWTPDFSFACRPAPESFYSTNSPLRGSGSTRSQPHDPRQEATHRGERDVAYGRRVLGGSNKPLSPVRERFRSRGRYPRGDMMVEVPRTLSYTPSSPMMTSSPMMISSPSPMMTSPPMMSPPSRSQRTPSSLASSPITRDGARSLLLSGLSETEARRLSRSFDRRESTPLVDSLGNSPTTIHPEILQLREHLRSLGPVYLGNTSAADVLVQGTALRRSSLPGRSPTDSPGAKTEPGGEPADHDMTASDEQAPSADGREFGSEIVVRAMVRPRQPDRRPFVVQRKFDLDELRATIPDPSPTHDSPTPSSRRRSSVADLSSPYASPTASGFPPATLIGRARRRSTSARHGPVPSSPGSRRAPASAGPEVKLAPRGTNNIMPIHLEYARSYLPVLAALLLSGHVREGDVLEIPIPHPQAWAQTVAHVYTGRGELTEAVRENILYLGGKV